MTRSHNSLSDPLREAMGLFDEAVTDIRNQGYTRENALTRAAARFGLTLGRARKLLYGEASAISDHEREAIRRRYLDHLDEQAAHYEQRLESAKARRRQMEIGL